MRRILIVGGGVVGTSIAWHAAERGLGEVVVLERDRLGSGTTWHSAGNITWKPVPDSDAPIKYMLDLLPRLERESGGLPRDPLAALRELDAPTADIDVMIAEIEAGRS